MKTANPASGTLQVLLLALLGLCFYVLVFGLLGLLGGMIISRVAHAQSAGDIDNSFTGSWFDPAQGGQGLMLEVLPDNRLFALWFAFDPAGKQSWFGGVGSYSGNTATITAVLPTGGRWIPNFDSSAIVSNTWGALTFSFADHDHGRVDFNSVFGYGTGGMDLQRLTNIATQDATGTPIGSPGAVIADASGNVYFSSNPNRVFKVDAQGAIIRVAGAGAPGYSGDGGSARDAQFNFPLSYLELVHDPIDFDPLVGGLALDAAHNLYIADAYNNRVRKIDSNGIVATVLGNGFRANSGDGGPAANATIYWPQGVAADKFGNLYVTSAYGPLRKILPNGIVSTIAGTICGAGYLGKGLCAPEQIAVDAAGDVFAPDGYCRVREVHADGSVVTVAGDDRDPSGGLAFTCGYSGDGGPATKAAMSAPYSVAVDANGNLYIADTGNHCIRKVSAGIINTVAGKCTQSGFAGDGGSAKDALLDEPRGVAVGADGSIYIADTNNNRIRKVAANGLISTIAGNGATPPSADQRSINPAFTGNWFDPTQAGHGLMLEVLSNSQLLAYWFSFDPAGDSQVWFGGIGSYSDNVATIPLVVMPTGGHWIPNFDPGAIELQDWGTLKFTFLSCDRGQVEFSSGLGYGSGSMNLTRLTQPAGLTCP
jgi:sugar lactone lactonase YvrE